MRGWEILEEYKLDVCMINEAVEYEFAYLTYDSLEEAFDGIRSFKPIKFYVVTSYEIRVIEE